MPCVLPVIGLKVLSFAKQGGQSRADILGLNLAYAAGLLAVFMVLATLAALVQLGLGNENLNWGELNTFTSFKVSMTALVFAMALAFLGVWEIPIPGFASSSKATELSAQEGPVGAFCMGAFTTLLATPCSGPFLGPVFGYTITQPPLVTYAVFGSVGLGMALPYLRDRRLPGNARAAPQARRVDGYAQAAAGLRAAGDSRLSVFDDQPRVLLADVGSAVRDVVRPVDCRPRAAVGRARLPPPRVAEGHHGDGRAGRRIVSPAGP